VAILFYLLLLCAFIQWIYWVAIFAVPAFTQWNNKPLTENEQLPVSVIICAKNEAENLKHLLPFVLQQQYSKFEVVVVNDASTDDTQQVLVELQKQFSYLVIVSNQSRNLKGKRNALLKGIHAASNEWLVLTDADCKPTSDLWLQYITKPLRQGKEIAVSYSPYRFENGFLNTLIRYETFFTAIQYYGFTLAGMPYMATGRNMAYTKSFFNKSQKFASDNNSVSGDDDLLVNELATENNIQLVLNENSFVESKPLSTWRAWFTQKTRHYQAGFHYKLSHQVILGIFYSSWLLFYIISIVLWTSHFNILFVAEVVFFITLTKWLIGYMLMKRFHTLKLWIYLPLLDFMLPLFLFTLGTLSLFNKGKWKN
jgi:cellulose synthase/poly-beta-1,6-N-acetylglucosamine synthase-like glycosyltransferase